ncbi:MAG TPA: hypothetical protein VKB19_06035 [Pedobacter sp.]|nr:hypothetical protein [Pedobacter sp.]
MYKATLIVLCAIVFMACDKKDPECGDRICTEEFAMINFTFTKKDGTGVSVKDFSVINQRTGDSLKAMSAAYLDLAPGTYVVADDNHTKKLSEEGDDLKITGTYEATNQTKSAIIKVAGGKCACHIRKISGPAKLAFD